jgi:hypothetical protein
MSFKGRSHYVTSGLLSQFLTYAGYFASLTACPTLIRVLRSYTLEPKYKLV